MLGGRLKRLAFWRRSDAADEERSPERTKSDSPAPQKDTTPKAAKSTGESTPGGVTLRIPSWFLRGLAAVGVLAVIGFGVRYLAIRDTGPSAAQKRAEEQQRQHAAAAARAAQCQQQVGGLLSAEEDLNGRLSGSGMTEADYLSRVGNVSAAYGQTPIKSLQSECLVKVGVPTESAMNAYIDASDTWNNCLTDFSCNVDSITPELQSKWAKATLLINEAKQGLSQLQTP